MIGVVVVVEVVVVFVVPVLVVREMAAGEVNVCADGDDVRMVVGFGRDVVVTARVAPEEVVVVECVVVGVDTMVEIGGWGAKIVEVVDSDDVTVVVIVTAGVVDVVEVRGLPVIRMPDIWICVATCVEYGFDAEVVLLRKSEDATATKPT